eukprot:13746615-Alexandrium_andersonii.AAC.1
MQRSPLRSTLPTLLAIVVIFVSRPVMSGPQDASAPKVLPFKAVLAKEGLQPGPRNEEVRRWITATRREI